MSYNKPEHETNSQKDYFTPENFTFDQLKQVTLGIQLAKRSKKLSIKKYKHLCRIIKMLRLLGVWPNSHKNSEIIYRTKDVNTDIAKNTPQKVDNNNSSVQIDANINS